MTTAELAHKIRLHSADQSPQDVARKCLMFLNAVDHPDELDREGTFNQVWNDIEIKFKAATDQHAAMTSELEQLACSDPREFSPDQIWILVRAIKVQSQVLRLLSGDSVVNPAV